MDSSPQRNISGISTWTGVALIVFLSVGLLTVYPLLFPPPLGGIIEIDGSSTVFPITEAAADAFRVDHPHVRIPVGVSGTGGGFSRFVRGEIDMNDASRPIKDSERLQAEENAVEYLELEIGIDGLSVVVHPDNEFLNCLTIEELNHIWRAEDPAQTWKEVRSAWPDDEIRLYGPGTDSGTFDYFTEVVNGVARSSRPDFTASEDDNVLIQGIAGDPLSLGYFGYAYYVQNTERLKIVAIDEGSGCVEPAEDSITSGEYPLARPLFIYVNIASLARPEVEEFVVFYMRNAVQFCQQVGYTPQLQPVYDDNLRRIGVEP